MGKRGGFVLGLGATGRVGRMVRELWDSSALPLLSQSRTALGGDTTEILWQDLEDPSPLVQLAEVRGVPEAMLMLAGVTTGSAEALNLNSQLALASLKAAKLVGCPRLLIASSSAVYGHDMGRPFGEADALRPVNDYGRSKVEMESVVLGSSEGVEVCCLRIGNVLGADSLMQSAEAVQGGCLRLDRYPDGTGPTRSYIGPKTLASVLAKLTTLKGRVPSILNVAVPRPVSMSAILDAANVEWQWRDRSDSSGQNITLSCDRLEEYYNFSPEDFLVSEMVRQYRMLK